MEFIDLKAQYKVLKDEINENIQVVLNNGQYILGDFVKELEDKLSQYVGSKYCVTCANGTDALQLALMVWNIGQNDAVFLPSFTFYSTAEVVSAVGATPIFVDVCSNTFNIDVAKLEKAIKQVIDEGKLNPKVIIPVDLFGQPADYTKIRYIASKYKLFILEDGAQGFGGQIGEKKVCSFGDISTTSFFPAKPLGCYGDGGAIFTDNKEYYNKLLSLRVHGKGSFKYDNVRIGMNSRLDTMQAAVLLPKLKAFKEYELDKRNEVAKYYSENLKDIVDVPFVPSDYISSWAQYTILLKTDKERSYVQEYLKKNNIPTMIYYPKPLHKQTVYADYQFNLDDLIVSDDLALKCLSLPMHPYLTKESMDEVISQIKKATMEFKENEK